MQQVTILEQICKTSLLDCISEQEKRFIINPAKEITLNLKCTQITYRDITKINGSNFTSYPKDWLCAMLDELNPKKLKGKKSALIYAETPNELIIMTCIPKQKEEKP